MADERPADGGDTSAIYPSLRDKAIFVSGGGTGIGAGLVEAFARQGARVAFVDIAQEASEALCTALSDVAHPPVFVRCDITDTAAYQSVLSDLMNRIGGCDVLLNNAANDERHELGRITDGDWDARMAVNLKHQFFAAQAVAPAMQRAGGGSIVNFGSISWHLGLERLTLYQTAKAAIEGLTRSLAREYGRQNIRVNCIIPGNVQTPKQERWYTPEGEAEIVAAQCLDGRIQPRDVAALAMFLASDDARFCTGHNYWVDAGWR